MNLDKEAHHIDGKFGLILGLTPICIPPATNFDFDTLIEEIDLLSISPKGLDLIKGRFELFSAVFKDKELSEILWDTLKEAQASYTENLYPGDKERTLVKIQDICKKVGISKKFMTAHPEFNQIIQDRISELNDALIQVFQCDMSVQLSKLKKAQAYGVNATMVCRLAGISPTLIRKNKEYFEDVLQVVYSDTFIRTIDVVKTQLKEGVGRLVSGQLQYLTAEDKFTKRNIIVESGINPNGFYVNYADASDYLDELYKNNKSAYHKRVDLPYKAKFLSRLAELKAECLEGKGELPYISRQYLCQQCGIDTHYLELRLSRYLHVDAERKEANKAIRLFHGQKLKKSVDSLNKKALAESIYNKLSFEDVSLHAGYEKDFLSINTASLPDVVEYIHEVFKTSLEERCFKAARSLIEKHAILAWSEYEFSTADIEAEANIGTGFKNFRFSQSVSSHAKDYIEGYRKKCEADILHALGMIEIDLTRYSYEDISVMANLPPWFLRTSLAKLPKVASVLGLPYVSEYRGDKVELSKSPELLYAAMKRILTDTPKAESSSHLYSIRRLLIEADLPHLQIYNHVFYFKDILESFEKGVYQYQWGMMKSVLIDWRNQIMMGKSPKINKVILGDLSGLGRTFVVHKLDQFTDILEELKELKELRKQG